MSICVAGSAWPLSAGLGRLGNEEEDDEEEDDEFGEDVDGAASGRRLGVTRAQGWKASTKRRTRMRRRMGAG